MYKQHKYKAKQTIVDGIKFPSRGESKRYKELKLLERSSKITNLILQPAFLLQDKFKDKNNKSIRAITYIADFQYTETNTGLEVVEDFKGVETEVFKIKRKMFLLKYPEYDFRVVK